MKNHLENPGIYKQIFQYSAEGIALTDIEGKFLHVNPSFCSITGYTEADLLNKKFSDIIHPDDLVADSLHLRKLEDKEINSYTIRKRCLHKNGTYIRVFFTASSIYDAAGKLLYYITQIHNISDNKDFSFIDISQKSRAIFESDRAYNDLKQIFNSTGTYMCLVDTKKNIARINDLFLKLLKMNNEKVIGYKCFDIIRDVICNCDECPFERIIYGEYDYEFESNLLNEESICPTFNVTASAFTSPDGGINGITLSFIDITEISKLEAKIAEVSEYERQKLGQLLHDELGQHLTGLTFRIEALKNIMNTKAYPEAEDIKEMSILTKAIQSHIRRIMIGLYPANIKYDKLFVALNDMAAETEKLYQVKCRVIIEGNVNITDDSDTTQLFYIAKESVNNAIKHANATQIIITLSCKNKILTLLIQNNIIIKEDDIKVKTKGLGLRIMEYRAKSIGARFEYFIKNSEFNVRVWRISRK